MAEYVFDFDRFEEPDLGTGMREAVVRCRDCAHCMRGMTNADGLNRCRLHKLWVATDFFCAAGKGGAR